MRWLRLYDDTINDPKILKLPEALRWHWIAMLCIASKSEGKLPPLDDVAIQLRVTTGKATEIIAALSKAGLLDKTDTGFAPHNWDSRQYKTDVTDPTAASRSKRYRDKKRDASRPSRCDDSVESKRPESEAEADTEAKASGAEAPDHRKRLFDEGLSKLAQMTGKGPDACRAFVGKLLRAAGDDAVVVLGLIEDAERNQVVNPSAWIAARLKPAGAGNAAPENRVIQAADDLRRQIAGFDGPSRTPDGVRSGESASSPRLLSHG